MAEPTAIVTPTPDVAPPPATPVAAAAPVAVSQLVRDPTTGAAVLQRGDGMVLLRDAGGQIHKVAPHNVAAALRDPAASFMPATHEDVEKAQQQRAWNKASAGEQAAWAGRQLISATADGLLAAPRTAAAIGYGLAGQVSPLEESLSGHAIVEKAHGLIVGEAAAHKASEHAREMSEGVPWLAKTALDVGGFLAGGELAGGVAKAAELGAEAIGLTGRAAKGVGAAAEALTGEGASKLAERGAEGLASAAGASHGVSSRVGRYAEQAAEGAQIGLVGGTEESWVEDKPLTAESQWAHMGIGALLGGGTSAAGDVLRGAGGVARKVAGGTAERVFGRASEGAARLGAKGDAASAEEIVQAVVGTPPAPGVGQKLRDVLDGIRDKVETAQSLRTGAPKEALERVGALRNSPEAVKAQEMFAHRDELLRQGTTDLTGALRDLHEAAEPIYNEARNLRLKRDNIAPLITGDADAIMATAQGKAAELSQGLESLQATTGRGRSLFGGGKAVADMKAAYEDAIDALGAATAPEDAAIALDGFKRAMGRVKVNAESSASRVTSGVEMGQARARAELASQVYDKTRTLLEDTELWGKFGDAQRTVNSAWKRMLETDSYVHPKIAEMTGRLQGVEDFGRAKWEMSEARVGSYLDGLGTPRSAMLDDKLRDNIVTRKQLAEALVKHYELGEHAPALQRIVEASDKSLAMLRRVDESVAATNQIRSIIDAEAATKGSGITGASLGAMLGGAIGGAPGAAAGAMLGHVNRLLTSPGSMIRQAIAMRQLTQRMTGRVTRAVGEALSGGAEGAAAMRAAAGHSGVAAIKGVVRQGARDSEAFAGVRKFAAENAKEHAKGALIRRLEGRAVATASASGEEHRAARNRAFAAATTHVTRLASDPIAASEAVANMVGHVEHGPTQTAMVGVGMSAIGFLASKMPRPLYANAVPDGDPAAHVPDSDKDRFLRYVEAADDPTAFFDDLRTGRATPEAAETAAALTPSLFAKAQQQVAEAYAAGRATAPYQERLKIQRLLGLPIEPIASASMQGFVAASSAAAATTKPPAAAGAPKRNGSGGSGGESSRAATSLRGPLDSLKL